MPLGETVRTVGQRLQDRGVHTAYIGKWHLDGGDYFGQGSVHQDGIPPGGMRLERPTRSCFSPSDFFPWAFRLFALSYDSVQMLGA